jgi:hypothetical protein
MQNFISPNFGPEKLESPTYEDLIDVFEDRMRNWFLLPAARFLRCRAVRLQPWPS